MTAIQLAYVVTTLVVFNIATTNVAYAMTMTFLLFVPLLLFGFSKLMRRV